MILAVISASTEEHTGGVVEGLLHNFEGVGVNSAGLIAQFIVFMTLALLLKRFAFDPILEVMDQRRKLIADSLSNADKIKAELAAAEATRKEILTKANEQAAGLIADAQKAASAQIQKAAQDAIATAEDIINKANEATKLEREREFSKLKSEVSALVSELTTKVIGRTLTDADKTRLNEEVLTQVGRN
jgi:F-type H+-transporting ATPase subunit b